MTRFVFREMSFYAIIKGAYEGVLVELVVVVPPMLLVFVFPPRLLVDTLLFVRLSFTTLLVFSVF